jgi:hypothetical protein
MRAPTACTSSPMLVKFKDELLTAPTTAVPTELDTTPPTCREALLAACAMAAATRGPVAPAQTEGRSQQLDARLAARRSHSTRARASGCVLDDIEALRRTQPASFPRIVEAA